MKTNIVWKILSLSMIVAVVLSACAPPTTSAPEEAPVVPEAPPAEEVKPTEAPPVVTEAPPSGEVKELIVWDIPNSEPYTQWWKDYTDEFNATHPGVKISYEVFDGEVAKAKRQAAAAADALPDILYISPGPEPTQFFRDGKLRSLDGLLKTELWFPSAIEQCSVDGTVACMPMYFAPGYIYYNKKMFATAGVDPQSWANPYQPTWEEFIAACDALKAAGFDPIALGNGDTWPGLWFYWGFQNRFGGNDELYKAINDGGTYQSPSFIKAGELSQELADKGYFTPDFNSYSGTDKYTVFTQGNGAMIYQGTWMLGNITDQAPTDFEFDFFIFPSFTDGNPSSQGDIMAGIDAMWISTNTKYPEIAAEYLNGFADPERALEFVLNTQNIPAVKSVTAPAGQENDVLWRMANLISSASGVSPWWDISALPPAVNEEMISMGQGLLIGEISPEEFAKRLDIAAGR